jgi:hypothetical protein
MVNKTVKCVGVNYTIAVPETAAEFDSLAKRDGACVDEAISNVIYRGTNADFRDAYLNALIAKYNYVRPTKADPSGKKNEDGSTRQVFENSEAKEIGIIVALHDISEETQQTIADDVMGSKDAEGNAVIAFDPSQRERKPREASIGKQDLETALAFLRGDEASLKKVLKNIKKQGGVDVALTGDEAADQKAIAVGIKAVRNNLSKSLLA